MALALPVLDNQSMGQLEEIGERDGWICWLCDQPVDREMSSNDPRGPRREKVPRTYRGP